MGRLAVGSAFTPLAICAAAVDRQVRLALDEPRCAGLLADWAVGHVQAVGGFDVRAASRPRKPA